MSPDEKRHKDCPVEIRYKMFSGSKGNVAGLFCSCHDKWVKWLTDKDAEYAIKELKVPVKKYTPRNNLSYTQYMKSKKKKTF